MGVTDGNHARRAGECTQCRARAGRARTARAWPRRGPRRGVQAFGICHSDSFTIEGHFPGITYPRVPGHAIACRSIAGQGPALVPVEGPLLGFVRHGDRRDLAAFCGGPDRRLSNPFWC